MGEVYEGLVYNNGEVENKHWTEIAPVVEKLHMPIVIHITHLIASGTFEKTFNQFAFDLKEALFKQF